MKNRLYGESDFKAIEKESDVIRLIKLIQTISCAYESKSYLFVSIHQAIKAFYPSYQINTASYNSYM